MPSYTLVARLVFTIPTPSYAQRQCSDDPDEVASWVAKRDGHHSRVVHETGAYGFEAALVAGPRFTVGWARNILGHTIRGVFLQPCLHIPLAGAQHYAYGRRRIDVGPGDAMYLPAGTDITRRCGTSLILGLDVETDTLANEVAARTADARLSWSALPHKINCVSGPAALQAPLRALVAALSPGGASTTVRQCEQRLLESLVDTLCATTAPPRTGKLAARRLADLEQWIDAHIDQPITIGQLSRVAGVRDRCLQLAFQARRGMSPIRFVLERRLAAAHALLSRAGESASVTDIATGVGFTHLGRFSVSYRHVFGESPSQTLQRRQLGPNG